MFLVAMAAGARHDEPAVKEFVAVTGLTPYEAATRLRTFADSPGILTSYADAARAEELCQRLRDVGFTCWSMTATRPKEARLHVQRWRFEGERLHIEGAEGEDAVPIDDVRLLLHGVRHRPDRGRDPFVHLYAASWQSTGLVHAFAFTESLLEPETGPGLEPTRTAHFSRTLQALRRHCARATYDDRLVSRAHQIRMLGMTLQPENHLDIAIALLAAPHGTKTPYR